jgi:L-2-hydroxyglutarate oxidase
MVNRVKRFLPKIDAKKITEKGFAGIRSSIVDENGKFVPDVIFKSNSKSFHILNYNSPGATGVLPFSAFIVNQLNEQGLVESQNQDAQCGPWKFNSIIEKMTQ